MLKKQIFRETQVLSHITKMKLREIKIKNFKGISLLDFKPKKINVIVGKNNTGKTSVLEAIDLLFNSDEIDEKYHERISYIIHSGSKCSEILGILEDKKNSKVSLKISKANEIEVIDNFKKDLIDALINFFKNRRGDKIEITEEIKSELLSRLDEWITPELRREILKRSILLVKNEKKIIKYPLNILSMSYLPSYRKFRRDDLQKKLYEYLKDKFGSKGFKLDEFDLRVLIYEIPFNKIHEIFEKKDVQEVFLIKDMLETETEIETMDDEIETQIETQKKLLEIKFIIKEHDLLKNLEELNFDLVSFKNKSEINVVPFSFLGDGFKAMVYLLWHLSSKNMRNTIVLLDEPENHMHPGYIHELVSLLIKFSDELNVQFFISTHSIDFIDTLFSKNFSKEEQKHLEKELLILRMQKIGDFDTSEYLNYEDAKHVKDDLLLDLRGT